MAAVGPALASVDEANLVLDHAGQVNVFLIAGILSRNGFIGADGTPDMDALRTALASRVAVLAPLRRIPVLAGRRHHWAESSPDLERHIRLLSTVEGLPGLERLCGELMSVPLPRDRPMWELLVVPGASADGVGFVLRIHHAIADGIAAVSIAQHLFDPGEEPAPRTPVPPAVRQSDPVRGVWGRLERLALGLRRLRMTLSRVDDGATVLLGERSAHRGVAFMTVDLAALEVRVRPVHATVNDALLAGAAAGYRAALVAAGEAVPERLRVSVPVALPRRGTSGNQVGVMLVRLPLGEPDPDVRLRLISIQTRSEKTRARQQGTLELMRGPLGARVLDRVAHRQHIVAGFVTNVPGPSGALRLAGATAVTIWPVAVLAGNVRLGVAALSYDGRLCCGVHFDIETVPGAQFSLAMRDELARLPVVAPDVLHPPAALRDDDRQEPAAGRGTLGPVRIPAEGV